MIGCTLRVDVCEIFLYPYNVYLLYTRSSHPGKRAAFKAFCCRSARQIYFPIIIDNLVLPNSRVHTAPRLYAVHAETAASLSPLHLQYRASIHALCARLGDVSLHGINTYSLRLHTHTHTNTIIVAGWWWCWTGGVSPYAFA